MKTLVARRVHHVVLLGLLFLPACASESGPDGRRAGRAGDAASGGRAEGHEEEQKKRGSGISQVGRVRPGGPALPSTESSGVDLERLWSEFDDWEPTVAADRGSPYVYQLTTRYLTASGDVYFRSSSDGGETWGQDVQVPALANQQYDPQLAVASDGTVFAMWLEFPGYRTFLTRSSDHGATWTTPVRVETTLPWTDHGWLAVSDDGRDLYVAVNSGDSHVIASHDGGATFGTPVLTETSDQDWIHTGGAVAPDGTAYFGAAEYFDSYRGETNVHVLRSADGGQTWTTTQLGKSRPAPPCRWAPGCYRGFFAPSTGVAVDPAGTVVFVYNAGTIPDQPQQIYAHTSLDGVFWSDPVLISHSDKRANNAFPCVVAGPSAGEFSVIWQGDRNGDTSAWNTWMRRTRDSGATWGDPVRISTREDGAPYKSAKGYRFPYGDYMGASIDGTGRIHVIWGASVSYNGPGGTWYTRAQ